MTKPVNIPKRMAPLLAEEMLATDACWGKEGHFLLGLWAVFHLGDGPIPMCMQVVLMGTHVLWRKKRRNNRRRREYEGERGYAGG